MKLIIFIFLFFLVFDSLAQQRVIHINGIRTTYADANNNHRHLQQNLGSTYQVEFIWNPFGRGSSEDEQSSENSGFFSGASNSIVDFNELFVSKVNEEKFHNNFRDILAPFNQSTTLASNDASNVTSNISLETPSIQDIVESSYRVIKTITESSSPRTVILVPHSQGNLITNYIWAKYVEEFGNEAFKKIRIVNVANTSFFSPHNLNLTHVDDAILYTEANDSGCLDTSLERLPVRLDLSRTTPFCSEFNEGVNPDICPFILSSAPFRNASGVDRPNCGDHGFLTTYLSNRTVDVNSANSNTLPTFTSGNSFANRLKDLVDAARESLAIANNQSQLSGSITVSNLDFSRNPTIAIYPIPETSPDTAVGFPPGTPAYTCPLQSDNSWGINCTEDRVSVQDVLDVNDVIFQPFFDDNDNGLWDDSEFFCGRVVPVIQLSEAFPCSR